MNTTKKAFSVFLAVLLFLGCINTSFATYDLCNIKVNASPSVGGTVPRGGYFSKGETLTLTATPNRGYRFAGWYSDENQLTTSPTLERVVTEDETLTAKFEIVSTYTVTVEIEGLGQVWGAGVYYDGENVTLKAKPSTEDYWFCGWYDDNSWQWKLSDETQYQFVIHEDVNLQAIFTRTYKLGDESFYSYGVSVSAEPADGGTVRKIEVPAPDWYNIYLLAKPNDGYRFVEWVEYYCIDEDYWYSSDNLQIYTDEYTKKYSATENPTFLGADDFLWDAPGIVKVVAKFEKESAPADDGDFDQPTQPDTSAQSDNPTLPTSQQQQDPSKACKYCGGIHAGFPGVIVGFFHSILALFGLKKK